MAIPSTSSSLFKPPTLLFPPEADQGTAKVEPEVFQRPWEELGGAIQDKYLTRAHWLIKNGHMLQRQADELAQEIYQQHPTMYTL